MPPQRGNPTSKTSLNQSSNIASLRKASTMGISFLGHPSCVASTANQRETEGIPKKTHLKLGSGDTRHICPSSWPILQGGSPWRHHNQASPRKPRLLLLLRVSAPLAGHQQHPEVQHVRPDVQFGPGLEGAPQIAEAQAMAFEAFGGRPGGEFGGELPGLERKAEAGGSLKDPQVEVEVG